LHVEYPDVWKVVEEGVGDMLLESIRDLVQKHVHRRFFVSGYQYQLKLYLDMGIVDRAVKIALGLD
jgi:hypothetical protein